MPRGRQGMLLVRGPTVMKGYLNRPDLTAEVMRGDWYVTGDLATIDEDDYITITGRISRFSKIGGEMVPHLGVETAVREVLAADDQEVQLAVTAVHDPTRGERLVVLHTGFGMSAAEICRRMVARGLPPLVDPLARQFPPSGVDPPVGHGQARHVAVEGNGGAGICRVGQARVASAGPPYGFSRGQGRYFEPNP